MQIGNNPLLTDLSRTLIRHSTFANAKSGMEQAIQLVSNCCEPVGLALIGETRTGKTTVIDDFCSTYPVEVRQEYVYQPILRIVTPSKPSVKSLADSFLVNLNDSQAGKGSEIVKTNRLKTLIKGMKTRMIIIDEFQHFYDKGTRSTALYVTDWLKTLIDETGVALVVSGLPSCELVLAQNEQLAGRFLNSISMVRFGPDEANFTEFRGVLASFNKRIAGHISTIDFSNEEMAYRMFCATGGLMGYVSKFLKVLVSDALQTNAKQIDLSCFEKAFSKSTCMPGALFPEGLGNPFSNSFKVTAPALEIARRIGVPVLPPEKKRRTRH